MKRLFIALLFSTVAFPAWATCTVVVSAGTIETVYCNAESTTFASPYATLTDAVAGQLGTWAQTMFNVPANQAFGAWFDYVMNWTTSQMQASLTVPATKPVITPNQ